VRLASRALFLAVALAAPKMTDDKMKGDGMKDSMNGDGMTTPSSKMK